MLPPPPRVPSGLLRNGRSAPGDEGIDDAAARIPAASPSARCTRKHDRAALWESKRTAPSGQYGEGATARGRLLFHG